MGSAIIVAAITYGAGLLMLLNAVEAVVCVGLMVKQKWKANEKKRSCVRRRKIIYVVDPFDLFLELTSKPP